MAQIKINEVSANYSYNIGTSSFATVALPITSSWGPGFVDAATLGTTEDAILEEVVWKKFPATQAGLESFVSTYRGPAANYRLAKDYSYQMAMTLLTAGYDVLVCRLCPGTKAQGEIKFGSTDKPKLVIKAKYPGTFGNMLTCTLTKVVNTKYMRMVVYVTDASNIRTAVENIVFTFDVDAATDAIPYIDEVSSNFVDIILDGSIEDGTSIPDNKSATLAGGADKASSATLAKVKELANARYGTSGESTGKPEYVQAIDALTDDDVNATKIDIMQYMQWIYNKSILVYDLLTDKLSYNPERIICPWDDQNTLEINGEMLNGAPGVSPIHEKLMDVAYYSRCATALIDTPKAMSREFVYNDSTTTPGYAQKLSRNKLGGEDGALYASHSALFGPWGQYQYVGTSKMSQASPSFLALMIQRAMILNQSAQYEWALPTNRRQTLPIGKLDYTVSKKYLDLWQTLEGVGVNAVAAIPDLGTSIWGNSTLFEVLPATYQALANLSTRYLVNAVKNIAYKCGLAITFQYNNDEAYSSFYAGVTPTLDTMKNVGAIDDYYVKMAADINGLDQVNANSVFGKIYLTINGVINDINIDLIALPSSVNLDEYRV